MVFSRGEDTETTLNATGGISEFDRQRALSHPEAKGIPIKEFKVDIRKPNNLAVPQSNYSRSKQQ